MCLPLRRRLPRLPSVLLYVLVKQNLVCDFRSEFADYVGKYKASNIGPARCRSASREVHAAWFALISATFARLRARALDSDDALVPASWTYETPDDLPGAQTLNFDEVGHSYPLV